MSKAITTTRRTSGISNFVFKGGEGKLREMTMFFADIETENGKYGDFVLECFGHAWAHRFPILPEGQTAELCFVKEEAMAMATLMLGSKPADDAFVVDVVRAAQTALREHFASEATASSSFAVA